MIEYDLFLNDKNIEGFGLFLRPEHEHPAPSTIDNLIMIPGKNGEIDMGSSIGSRPLNFPLGVKPQLSRSKLQQKIRYFMFELFDQYGKPKEIKLTLGYEPEKWYKVKYSGSMPIERLVTMGAFTLPLKAYDPYAYAPMTYYDPDFVAIYNTGTQYDDNETEYTNQTHTPFTNIRQYAGVFNYSHFATPFSFVIEGYVKNPKITNQTTGKSAQLNIIVEADERLYFDSVLKTTWKVKVAEDEWFWIAPKQMMKYPSEWDKLNKYNDMSGHFLELASGDNSLLFEGVNPNASINFNWLHRFL